MKMKQNEENKGLNNKKAYEDQFTTFVSSSFGSPIHSLILSYSCTLRAFLEHAWRILVFTWIWRKKAKESRKAQGNMWINIYIWIALQVIDCMCGFLVNLWMHGICMWFSGYVLSLTCITWIDNGFSLPFPFLG